MSQHKTKTGNGILRPSARPMEMIVDANGSYWMCDRGVDANGDLAAQGCVNVDDMSLKPED